jgi:hypothetical protein
MAVFASPAPIPTRLMDRMTDRNPMSPMALAANGIDESSRSGMATNNAFRNRRFHQASNLRLAGTQELQMSRRDDNYHTALEETPECARRIGIIIGLFGSLEVQLVDTFRWIAGMEFDPARVAMDLHSQFANEIAYVEAVCNAKQPNWQRG